MHNQHLGEGFDDWTPDNNDGDKPRHPHYAPPTAPNANVPASKQRPSAGRIVLIAILALMGGLLLLDWWAFSTSVSSSTPNGANAIPFLVKVIISSAYLAIAWRVFMR